MRKEHLRKQKGQQVKDLVEFREQLVSEKKGFSIRYQY